MCALESGKWSAKDPHPRNVEHPELLERYLALVGMFLGWNEGIACGEEHSTDSRQLKTSNRLFMPVTAIKQTYRRITSTDDCWAEPLNDTTGIIDIRLFETVRYLPLTRGEKFARDRDRLQPIKPCRPCSGRMTGDGSLCSVRGATYLTRQRSVRAIHSSPRRRTPSLKLVHHTFSM